MIKKMEDVMQKGSVLRYFFAVVVYTVLFSVVQYFIIIQLGKYTGHASSYSIYFIIFVFVVGFVIGPIVSMLLSVFIVRKTIQESFVQTGMVSALLIFSVLELIDIISGMYLFYLGMFILKEVWLRSLAYVPGWIAFAPLAVLLYAISMIAGAIRR